MAEYIEKEFYCKTSCHCVAEYCDKSKCPVWNAPAADVAPVVRCRDCTHLFGTLCAVCGLLPRQPDDFCSRGERKDGADHDT